DGVIVAGALFSATWVTLLGTVYHARALEPLALALTLAYPVAGITLVTVALLLLVRVPDQDRTMMALLTAGLMLIAVADIAYAYATAVEDRYYQAISLGWAWGFLAIGAAAMVSRQATHGPVAVAPRAPSRASIWLPFVPVAIAVAVCAPVLLPRLGAMYLVGSVTMLAVMVRQLLVLDENRRLLVEASDRALHDPLTGLANRTLFADRLTQAIKRHERDALTVAVLVLDLDDFKLVNDTLGHPAGDAMLVEVAVRLTGTVRSSDTVARLGGDEFAVLIEGEWAASHLTAQRVVQAFDQPFVIEGEDLLVRPSVGLAVASANESAVTVDELLRQADIAMYAAKRSRSSQLSTFAPELDLRRRIGSAAASVAPEQEVGGIRDSARLLGELRYAIEHASLSAVYQPKFDLRTDRVVGVEALVRWPHPRHGLLAPEKFLPLVREHGLMPSVTSLMLNLALDDAATWHSKGVGVPVSVNFFAPSISDADLPGQIVSALDARGLPPEVLTVEITEDLLLENLESTREAFTRLRDLRIRTAIDDFGTGYSALWYLRDFPVHEVKLDREFIAPILTQPTSAAIVRAVIDLAHALGVTPVAEGVENAETAAKLLEYGCDVAQGYYYSPPLPAPAILDLLESQKPNQGYLLA
ncbi:MAG: EAL domain-containing protein, partial [Actinomycetia bacterium]|nr:EAL domain-containing protein [Actinomycetes bacterium]